MTHLLYDRRSRHQIQSASSSSSSGVVVLVTNVIIVVTVAVVTYRCRSRFVSIQISQMSFALFTAPLLVLDPRQSLDEEGSSRTWKHFACYFLRKINLKVDFHCRVKFYVLFTCVKNTHVNSFHCCVKSFCCAAFFTYVYVRFRPTNALGPGLKTKRAGIWFERQEKNGGSSEQAFAPSFLPSPEAKEKAKIQKKVLDKGYISKPFSTWRIPHASERNARKWPRVILQVF